MIKLNTIQLTLYKSITSFLTLRGEVGEEDCVVFIHIIYLIRMHSMNFKNLLGKNNTVATAA